MNIAITGGMGTGKSRVATKLAELLGGMYVSADYICRDLLQIGNPGYLQMRKLFAPEFFSSDGSIDRSLLRTTIFSDDSTRELLDSILHPMVRELLSESAGTAQKKNIDLIAEVPLLFETGWQDDFDYSFVVSADIDVCVIRIVKRDHVSEKEAMAGIISQMSLEEKCKLADRVIDNSASFDTTIVALKQFVLEREQFSTKGSGTMEKS